MKENRIIINKEQLDSITNIYKNEKLMVNETIKNIYLKGKIELEDGKFEKLIDAISPIEGKIIYNLIYDNKLCKCLEVGMANGMSSLYILQAIKDLKDKFDLKDCYLTSIDPNQSTQYKNIARLNIKRASLDSLSIVAEEKSYEALPKILEKVNKKDIPLFDFIFIDGMHLFDYTLLDFFYADLILRKGGVIVLDDIKHPNVKACYNYIKTNYLHYKQLNVNSNSIAVFHKIDDDKRDWKFHKKFLN